MVGIGDIEDVRTGIHGKGWQGLDDMEGALRYWNTWKGLAGIGGMEGVLRDWNTWKALAGIGEHGRYLQGLKYMEGLAGIEDMEGVLRDW